jgi:hypothetical protein
MPLSKRAKPTINKSKTIRSCARKSKGRHALTQAWSNRFFVSLFKQERTMAISSIRWQVSLYHRGGEFFTTAETDLSHNEAVAYVVEYNTIMAGGIVACVGPWAPSADQSARAVESEVAA